MKLKDKLKLMGEMEKRNQARIRDYICKPRKRPSSGFKKRAGGNRSKVPKPK